jgi:TolB-like protein
VLPLANLSGDPGEDYFANGMTEALTADLAQIAALGVISRTSVIQYKGTKRPLPEIGRQILASTDRHLWARTYERDLGDILDLQNEVARAIAAEIRAKVKPQPPPLCADSPVPPSRNQPQR